jgi:hypothetical protein
MCVMKANRSRISSLAALVLGGFLVGAPLVARAAQPSTAAEADERAEHFTKLADNYKFQGGALWKTGNVQRAQADASNCTTVANAMRSSSVALLAAPSEGPLAESGAVVAVLVPNNKPAPSSPKCPAP